MAKNSNLEAVGNTINFLENKDQEVDFEQFQSAMGTAEAELNSSESIHAKQKEAIQKNVAGAVDNIENEKNRQFLMYYFHWCMKQLISQQQERLIVSPISAFPSTANLFPMSANEDRRGPSAVQVGRGASRDPIARYFLKDSHPNARYVGGVFTRSSNDGSPSPYVAYHSPNGNMTITGNFQEGWKDMVKLYQAADVSSVTVRGEFVADDTNAYQTLKTANDAGVTAVLGERGVYESGRLFAEQGAKENPSTYEADTKKYLNGVLNDETLGPRLREEMAQKGLGTKEELEKMGRDDLVEKCFEEMKSPKAEILPEEQSKVASEVKSKAAPEVKSRSPAPTSLRGENKILDTASRGSFNNRSTMTVGNQTIDIIQNGSGEMFVNGHKMPEEFTGQNLKAGANQNQLWINDKPVSVTKDGLTVDGRSVRDGQYVTSEKDSQNSSVPSRPRMG